MDPEVRQDDDRGYDEWKDSVLEQAHELKDEGLITPEQLEALDLEELDRLCAHCIKLRALKEQANERQGYFDASMEGTEHPDL